MSAGYEPRVTLRESRLDAEIRNLAAYMEATADKLEAWAKESREGGWSTHQVDKNRSEADGLRRRAAQAKSLLAAVWGKL